MFKITFTSLDVPKKEAKALKKALTEGEAFPVTLRQAQDVIAQSYGWASWNELSRYWQDYSLENLVQYRALSFKQQIRQFDLRRERVYDGLVALGLNDMRATMIASHLIMLFESREKYRDLPVHNNGQIKLSKVVGPDDVPLISPSDFTYRVWSESTMLYNCGNNDVRTERFLKQYVTPKLAREGGLVFVSHAEFCKLSSGKFNDDYRVVDLVNGRLGVQFARFQLNTEDMLPFAIGALHAHPEHFERGVARRWVTGFESAQSCLMYKLDKGAVVNAHPCEFKTLVDLAIDKAIPKSLKKGLVCLLRSVGFDFSEYHQSRAVPDVVMEQYHFTSMLYSEAFNWVDYLGGTNTLSVRDVVDDVKTTYVITPDLSKAPRAVTQYVNGILSVFVDELNTRKAKAARRQENRLLVLGSDIEPPMHVLNFFTTFSGVGDWSMFTLKNVPTRARGEHTRSLTGMDLVVSARTSHQIYVGDKPAVFDDGDVDINEDEFVASWGRIGTDVVFD